MNSGNYAPFSIFATALKNSNPFRGIKLFALLCVFALSDFRAEAARTSGDTVFIGRDTFLVMPGGMLYKVKGCVPYNKTLFGDNVRVFNLGPKLNTAYWEYNPVLNYDETFMIFTSRRDSTTGAKVDASDGQFVEDIMISVKKDGLWTQAKNVNNAQDLFPYKFNTEKHEAPVFISWDENTLIVYKESRLWYSTRQDTGFTSPVLYDKNVNAFNYQRHASYTKDESALYFSSEVYDEKTRRVHYDLFVTRKDASGNWSKPEALPAPINTPFNEDSPEITKDGSAMYFSSDRPEGFGGYDVYAIYLKDGAWTEPLNVCEPTNSPADDIFFKISRDGNSAYFSSNRLKGGGGMDLFKAVLDIPRFANCVDYKNQTENNVRIVGADTIEEGTFIGLEGTGSTVMGMKAENWHWRSDEGVVTNKSVFERSFDKPGAYTIDLEVSAVKLDVMESRYGCASRKITVLSKDDYRKWRRQKSDDLRLDDNWSDTDIEWRLNSLMDTGDIALLSEVENTFVNNELIVDALANDRHKKGYDLDIESITQPMDGLSMISNAELGLVIYKPRKNFVGTDRFSYMVVDENGKKAKAYVVVRVMDEQGYMTALPVRNDKAIAEPGVSREINVFENDLKGVGMKNKLTGVSIPASGTASIVDSVAGIIRFESDQEFVGMDAFTYSMKNEYGKVSSAFVSVQVGEDASEVKAIPQPDYKMTDVNQSVPVSVLSNDALPNGFDWQVTSVGRPANGVVKVLDPKRGLLLYSPEKDYEGVDAFTYVVSAGKGMAASEGVTIVVRQPPLLLASAETAEAEEKIRAGLKGKTTKQAPTYTGKTEPVYSKGISARLADVDTTNRPDLGLQPIYFDFDRTSIRKDMREAMAENVRILKENPNVVIQVISHTDARGRRSYNMDLSRRRARATMNYLVRNGVDKRLILGAVGMGEKKLANECGDGVRCTNEEHARNRRSDFVVIGVLKNP